MRTNTRLGLTLTCCVALAVAPALAQQNGAFSGSFQIGFRSVDVSGSPTKYAEDLNLEDGPRLFLLDLDYIPEDELRKFADKVTINVNNFGGDPFESLSISVEKFGNYDFNFDRRKSNYFYNDVILPIALAGDPAVARAGDFHHFDFDRVHDRGSFKIWMGDHATFNFGLNRYTRRGESTTTLDVSRDEFEIDKPIHESLNDYVGSFQYSWDKVTLVLEERYRQFDNVVELFLPGQSLGEDPEDATILDFYFFDQPYDYTSNDHIVRLVAQPNSNLLVRAQADFQSLDLDVRADERGAGTSFAGAPLEIDGEGRGEIDRDMELFDVDMTYRVNNNWAITFAARQNSLDQEGILDAELSRGESGRGDWDIDTTSLELGAQVNLSPKVTVAAGVREETRDIDSSFVVGDEIHVDRLETDQTGYFANLGWAPVKGCRVNLELEDSSFNDPFTLTAPTDRQRYKVRGQYKTGNGFSILGSYALSELDNDRSGWDSSSDQLNLRLGYHKDKVQASLGYSTIDVDRKIDQTVVTLPGFGGGVELPFLIAFDADSEFIDGRIRYDASDRVAFGGDFRMYDNSGSFGIEREDFRGWIELDVCKGYLLHLGYRTIDYNETGFNFDDYDAEIAEVSIGYRW